MNTCTDKYSELGLPSPYSYETQVGYVQRLLVAGYTLDTRKARYIGIYNLHSIIAKLKRKFAFNLAHGKRLCPNTGETPPQPVDIISMTPEQILTYKKSR